MDRHLRTLDLRRDSAQSKHERLKNHFINELLAGRLKPGEVIPSEQHLIETLGVARASVRQAMGSLENEGLIRRVQGKGTFVENDARRKLKRGQDIFALVVPQTHASFYPALLHGFEDAAHDVHHQTIICNSDNNVDRQAGIILQLLDKKIGGVAIVPTSVQPSTPAYQVRQLQEHGIPVVFCHRRVEGVAAPLLALPFYETGRLAGKVLAEHGHRRVAFFTYQRSLLPTTRDEDGFLEGLQSGGGNVSVETVYASGDAVTLKEETLWPVVQQMFAKPDPPTAIFATFDPLAEMIYLLLLRLNLRVPKDVSLLGEGGTWREGALTQRLTSVVVDEAAAGRQAASLLYEMRRGERPIDDNLEIALPLDLSKGETLARPAREMSGCQN